MKAKKISVAIRRYLKEHALKQARARRPTAVALSGGVDSCSVLAALMDEGVMPLIISYTPSTHESTDFMMARATAHDLGLQFRPAIVNMNPVALEQAVRAVLSLGFKSKVQVESLVPMVSIAFEARQMAVLELFTGDQADGYFALSKWAAHNYDRSVGVPFGSRSRSVKNDVDSGRIDAIRERYYREDFACTAGVAAVCAKVGVKAEFPYRCPSIARAFQGSLWSEVNQPRIKEPIRLAYESELAQMQVRPMQVNLHKGDSYFGDTLSALMMERFPGHATPRGLYAAMQRGEV